MIEECGALVDGLILMEKMEVMDKNLFQRHFVHQQSHVDWPWTNSDQLPESVSQVTQCNALGDSCINIHCYLNLGYHTVMNIVLL